MSDLVSTAARNGTGNDRDLLNATPEMIFVLDRDGRYLDFVPSSELEPVVPPAAFRGKTVRDVLPQETAEWILLKIHEAIDTGEAQNLTYTLLMRGEDTPFEGRIIPLDEGRVVAIVRDLGSIQESAATSAIDLELGRALNHAEFVLYYQPQLTVDSRQIIGMEALARWRHPARGILMPSEFIPAMERNGMISLLGEWVIRTACTQNKMWQKSGAYRVPVAVNVSARRFHGLNVGSLLETLEQIGLEPDYLRLEITETVIMEDIGAAIRVLTNLRTAGIGVAIDDFGLGYSSLVRIKDLPVDEMKIDKAFVHGLNTDPKDRAIVQLTIDLAHALGISVTAEGVETDEQLTVLRELRCDRWQGYLHARPLPPEELAPASLACSAV